eukprot:104412_1
MSDTKEEPNCVCTVPATVPLDEESPSKKELKGAEKRVHQVDWKEVHTEFNKGMEGIDWAQVHKNVQEGAWNEVHRQFREATEGVDWQGVFNDAGEGQVGKKNGIQDAIWIRKMKSLSVFRNAYDI